MTVFKNFCNFVTWASWSSTHVVVAGGIIDSRSSIVVHDIWCRPTDHQCRPVGWWASEWQSLIISWKISDAPINPAGKAFHSNTPCPGKVNVLPAFSVQKNLSESGGSIYFWK